MHDLWPVPEEQQQEEMTEFPKTPRWPAARSRSSAAAARSVRWHSRWQPILRGVLLPLPQLSALDREHAAFDRVLDDLVDLSLVEVVGTGRQFGELRPVDRERPVVQ